MEIIDNLLKNKKIVYFICFLLAIYISFIQSRLTDNQLKFFHNDFIRIIYLFIIIFVFNKNSIIGTLLVITYLTMSSSLISEDFYVTEKFFEFTPDQLSNMLRDPHNICKNGRHQRLCSKINQNYKIIEDSTKRIVDTCGELKNQKKRNKTKKINFLDKEMEYDNFKMRNNKKNNEYSKILQI